MEWYFACQESISTTHARLAQEYKLSIEQLIASYGRTLRGGVL